MKKAATALLLLISMATISVNLTSFQVEAQTANVNSWTTKAPMPTERIYLRAAVVNGIIYAIGGTHYEMVNGKSTQAPTNVNEAYNPATNTWTSKASMPIPLTNFGIAVYQNRIYCIGANTNEVYDPATDIWQSKTPMPTPRTYLQANVVDGKIYLIGGESTGTSVPAFETLNEAYDPVTDTWTTKSSMLLTVAYYVSAVVDDKIYIISGGSSGGNVVSAVQMYDPHADNWTTGAPIPTPVQTAAATTFADSGNSLEVIYVMGGLIQNDPFHSVNFTQIYSPQSNTWTAGMPLSSPRSGLATVTVSSTIYAIGGGFGLFNPQTNINQQYGSSNPNQTGSTPTPSPSLSTSPSPSPSLSPSSSLTPSPSIPEFPSWIILPLFLATILLTVISIKKKHMVPQKQGKSKMHSAQSHVHLFFAISNIELTIVRIETE